MSNPTISVPPLALKTLRALAAIQGVSIGRIVEKLADRAAMENAEAIEKYYDEKARRAAEAFKEFTETYRR